MIPGGGSGVTPGGPLGSPSSEVSIPPGSSAAGGARTSTRLPVRGGGGISGLSRDASTREYLCLVLVSSPLIRSPGERWLISWRKLLARSMAALARSTPAKLVMDKAAASAAARLDPPANRSERRRRRLERRLRAP